MENTITSIPGYRVYQYLLAINPHQELSNQIQAIKKQFAAKFKTPLAALGKPQITLVQFLAYQMTEQKIINRLTNIAQGITPFKVELLDFGSFPSHTIHINVTTKLPVQQVIKELKSAQNIMTMSKENKPHFMEEWHFTIARKLKPWQYEQGWLEYAHHHFSGRFIADNMVLFKRPEGETGYKQLMQFEFENLAVNTKQGNLFM
ncbi:MAG: 2'-5' RNA ligase family protein [Bacteroidota bacterium]